MMPDPTDPFLTPEEEHDLTADLCRILGKVLPPLVERIVREEVKAELARRLPSIVQHQSPN
jgi:hypothetical protein